MTEVNYSKINKDMHDYYLPQWVFNLKNYFTKRYWQEYLSENTMQYQRND